MEPLIEWIQGILKATSEQAQIWVAQYGFHAVVPTLLADPAGVPWAWIFLILFAGAAGLNVGGDALLRIRRSIAFRPPFILGGSQRRASFSK